MRRTPPAPLVEGVRGGEVAVGGGDPGVSAVLSAWGLPPQRGGVGFSLV